MANENNSKKISQYCDKCEHTKEEHSTFGSRCRIIGCNCVMRLSTGAMMP